MESLYKHMGGTYHWEGDYLIPDLGIGEHPAYDIGPYGRMHRRYLEENRSALYANLLLSGELWEHLAEIEKSCNERMERIVAAMAKQEGVTEALKATDQMKWGGCMNSIRNRAEEIVLQELVFSV